MNEWLGVWIATGQSVWLPPNRLIARDPIGPTPANPRPPPGTVLVSKSIWMTTPLSVISIHPQFVINRRRWPPKFIYLLIDWSNECRLRYGNRPASTATTWRTRREIRSVAMACHHGPIVGGIGRRRMDRSPGQHGRPRFVGVRYVVGEKSKPRRQSRPDRFCQHYGREIGKNLRLLAIRLASCLRHQGVPHPAKAITEDRRWTDPRKNFTYWHFYGSIRVSY